MFFFYSNIHLSPIFIPLYKSIKKWKNQHNQQIIISFFAKLLNHHVTTVNGEYPPFSPRRTLEEDFLMIELCERDHNDNDEFYNKNVPLRSKKIYLTLGICMETIRRMRHDLLRRWIRRLATQTQSMQIWILYFFEILMGPYHNSIKVLLRIS